MKVEICNGTIWQKKYESRYGSTTGIMSMKVEAVWVWKLKYAIILYSSRSMKAGPGMKVCEYESWNMQWYYIAVEARLGCYLCRSEVFPGEISAFCWVERLWITATPTLPYQIHTFKVETSKLKVERSHFLTRYTLSKLRPQNWMSKGHTSLPATHFRSWLLKTESQKVNAK